MFVVFFFILFSGTPASRCGVQPGDELTKLNDVSLHGLSIEESNSLLNKVNFFSKEPINVL